MIEPVERKIQEINNEKRKAMRKQREQNLVRWGFDGRKRNKNDIPLILTDEEYQAVLQADNDYSSSVKTDKNPMANVMFGLAVASIVIGVVMGIVLFEVVTDIGFVYLTLSIVIGTFIGCIFFGLCEVIKLLQQIVDKQ